MDDGQSALAPGGFRFRRSDLPALVVVVQSALTQKRSQGVGDEGIGAKEHLAAWGDGRDSRKDSPHRTVLLQLQEGNNDRFTFAALAGLVIAQVGYVFELDLWVALVYIAEVECSSPEVQGDRISEGATWAV